MKITTQSCQNNKLVCGISIGNNIAFDLDFQLDLTFNQQVYSSHIRQFGWDVSWLTKGKYQLIIDFNESGIRPGNYGFRVIAFTDANKLPKAQAECSGSIEINTQSKASNPALKWDIRSDDINISALSWRKGHADWFYRHFDHASRVIKDLMFNNSEVLKGKILDVGCGDGITDLGLYLRVRPELLVGIDPFEGFKNLEKFCLENHLPIELLQHDNLNFSNASGNDIPYPDDYFDVVLSWGSLEHIAGGHEKTLDEITRVLKPGGILFAHPGLYFGEYGNHLGEFFDDPFIHLKNSDEELHQKLMDAEANYMDRSGQVFPKEDYWQWYQELNPITVESLEKQLRERNYKPWRVALRSSNVVEYTEEMQKYPINDLAVREMYATFVLKK